ncbi:MAG: excinuclease ABC subunit UvrA, partial [Patulibacter sp.]|nr:excinuclease ABC subunit UvrA [Patulibacter sp.]
AEGQRRYVESLSAYARQFLGQMDKPDVDSIDGLSPAISIDQKTTSRNPRSTVGTVTEVHDYLRLLWARIGHPHCPNGHGPIAGQSVEQIIDRVMELPEGTRFMVLAPIVRGRKGEFKDVLEHLKADGFQRVRVDGELRMLDEQIVLEKSYKHEIAVVVDRLVMRGDVRKRLADGIEAAAGLAEGLVEVSLVLREGEEAPEGVPLTRVYSENFACLECGFSMPEVEPRTFSFNAPHGACPRCTGLGAQMIVDPDLVVPDAGKSLDDGAIKPWSSSPNPFYRKLLEGLATQFDVPTDVPWNALDLEQQEGILFGDPDGEKVPMRFRSRSGARRTYKMRAEGVIVNLERRYKDSESDAVKEKIEEYMSMVPCPDCEGSRLKPGPRNVLIGGIGIHQFSALSVHRALQWIDEVELTTTERKIANLIVREIKERLSFLVDVGIGYLTMDRGAATLSGGEAQRIRLATQIGSALVGVLYVLDEPSIGLHQRDNERLIKTLERLRDLGNSVLVVEHDEQTMRRADVLVDMGPGAGEHGGEVVANGTPAEVIANPESLTGQFLSGVRAIPVPDSRRERTGELTIRGARDHNLRNIDVTVPLGVLCGVTGVSGSGKSTLINGILHKAAAQQLNRARVRPGAHAGIDGMEALDKVIQVNQAPIGRTPRSNPATYTGIFDHIRTLFSQTAEARARGYKPGRFSFNVKGGRCEVCKGDGQIKIEMHFLPDVYVPCEQCDGKRYNRETLEIRFKGKSIADVLHMPVDEAVEYFENVPKIRRRLETIQDVGLGYVRLGQPATTLSGGEAQRVKLAHELARQATGRTLYILDEPTTGLHFADVERLLEVLQRLVSSGNSVVVIEHDMDVIKAADHLIDLGPEGGDGGGTLVAEGTPEQVAAVEASHTGRFLRDLVTPDASAVASGGTTRRNGDEPKREKKSKAQKAAEAKAAKAKIDAAGTRPKSRKAAA